MSIQHELTLNYRYGIATEFPVYKHHPDIRKFNVLLAITTTQKNENKNSLQLRLFKGIKRTAWMK